MKYDIACEHQTLRSLPEDPPRDDLRDHLLPFLRICRSLQRGSVNAPPARVGRISQLTLVAPSTCRECQAQGPGDQLNHFSCVFSLGWYLHCGMFMEEPMTRSLALSTLAMVCALSASPPASAQTMKEGTTSGTYYGHGTAKVTPSGKNGY